MAKLVVNHIAYEVNILSYVVSKTRNVVFVKTKGGYEPVFWRGAISSDMVKVDFSGTTGRLFKTEGIDLGESDVWNSFKKLDEKVNDSEEVHIVFPDSKIERSGVITNFNYVRSSEDPFQITFGFGFLAFPYYVTQSTILAMKGLSEEELRILPNLEGLPSLELKSPFEFLREGEVKRNFK